MDGEKNKQLLIQWRASMPIFKNTVILKQLALAIGLPFGLLSMFFVIMSSKSQGALYGLVMIGILLFLTWLFIIIVYQGKYEVEFRLDKQGVLCRTQTGQMKKNRVINLLTVVLGLLSGKPAAAGAGILAQSGQEVFIRWNRIKKVECNPQNRTILLQGGFGENVALFCPEERYLQIERAVREKTRQI
jgi:hypothetical protein